MADALDSGSSGSLSCVGSSPILRIGVRYQLIPDFFYVLSKADIRNPSLQLC